MRTNGRTMWMTVLCKPQAVVLTRPLVLERSGKPDPLALLVAPWSGRSTGRVARVFVHNFCGDDKHPMP